MAAGCSAGRSEVRIAVTPSERPARRCGCRGRLLVGLEPVVACLALAAGHPFKCVLVAILKPVGLEYSIGLVTYALL
jgi:hypothetical protein